MTVVSHIERLQSLFRGFYCRKLSPRMFRILLTSAPTGAGKTHACVKQIIKMIEAGETVILAQPTKALNEQTRTALHSIDATLTVEMINGDSVDKGVALTLASHLKQPPDKPHVIITTAESFNRLPFIANARNYHLIIDEIPNAFISVSIPIPHHHRLITDLLSVEPVGPSYSRINVTDKGNLRSLAENRKEDAIDSLLQPLTQKLNDDKFDAYVDLERYESMKRGSKDSTMLTVFFMRKPDAYRGYKSVRMIGARADETILVKWFKKKGVTFVDDQEMLESLRYREHINGPLIEFFYASERNWSLYGQEMDPDFRVNFAANARNLMGNKSFCWIDNKRNEDGHPYEMITDAIMVPHFAHGRNDYLTYDNIIILTAFNYATPDAKFLESIVGMSANEQKVSFDYHNTYQTLSRLSIRDPDNRNRKTIVLPDRLNAEWQSNVFPGSSVQSLGIDDRVIKKKGRPKVYKDAVERKRANRSKLESEQRTLFEKHDLGIKRIGEAGYQYECHEMSYISIVNNVTSYQGSVVSHKYRGHSIPLIMSTDQFIRYLRKMHKEIIANKNDNSLIMSALCIPGNGSQRAKKNALWGRHIYLDLDGTDLKPGALSRLFPYNEIITYNSYSNSDKELRYRAIFLTDEIVHPEVYTFLWRQIVQRIEDVGYQGKNSYHPKGERKLHGIDNNYSVVNTFNLPCQAKDGKSFFNHHNKGGGPINVKSWIENAIPTRFDVDNLYTGHTIANDIASMGDADNSYRIEALARYRQAISTINPATGKLNGSNDALYNLDQNLRRRNVESWEREKVLVQAANESRSPKDRMSDVIRYMKRR